MPLKKNKEGPYEDVNLQYTLQVGIQYTKYAGESYLRGKELKIG